MSPPPTSTCFLDDFWGLLFSFQIIWKSTYLTSFTVMYFFVSLIYQMQVWQTHIFFDCLSESFQTMLTIIMYVRMDMCFLHTNTLFHYWKKVINYFYNRYHTHAVHRIKFFSIAHPLYFHWHPYPLNYGHVISIQMTFSSECILCRHILLLYSADSQYSKVQSVQPTFLTPP